MLQSDPSRRPGDCLIAESRQIPAFGVLEQWLVPVIAVADDGTVVFANSAFEHFLGSLCDAVSSISYDHICSVLPTDETLFAVTRLDPKATGSTMHSGRVTIFVKMRKAAMRTAVDLDAVTMFEELMEHLSH